MARDLRKPLRFLFFGGTAAAVNMALMVLLVDWAHWNTPLWKNLANTLSIELSLLYSFVVYRIFVWNSKDTNFRDGQLLQLVRYHGSAGTAIGLRILLIFPLFDIIGVHHVLNTVFGALVSCALNYFLSNCYVFVPESETFEDEKLVDLPTS